MADTQYRYPFVLRGEILYFCTDTKLKTGTELTNDNDTVEIFSKHTKTNKDCELSREIVNPCVKTTKTSTQWEICGTSSVLREYIANQFIYYNDNNRESDYVVVTISGQRLVVFFAKSKKTVAMRKTYLVSYHDNRINAQGGGCGLVIKGKFVKILTEDFAFCGHGSINATKFRL